MLRIPFCIAQRLFVILKAWALLRSISFAHDETLFVI
jgi:hypothetical protein